MASERISEVEWVDSLPQDMVCSICMRVLHQPQMVNCCEQHFCKDCLDKWLTESSPTCPHCRAKSFSYMHMKQKTRKIGELKVYCPNKQYGCMAVLKYADYNSHLMSSTDQGCFYVELDCPNHCSTKIFRGKLLEHCKTLCVNRIVSCKHCKLQGKYHLLIKHVSECAMRPVACPKGCGVQVVPKDLEFHKASCPLETVPCMFSELGCKASILRKDMKKHSESTDHMSMVASSYITLKEDYMELQGSYDILQDSIDSLQDDYDSLQTQQKSLCDSHSLLQKQHATLQMEHNQFKNEYRMLKAECTAIWNVLQAVEAEQRTPKREKAKKPVSSESGEDLPRTSKIVSKSDTSKQDLGDDLILWVCEDPDQHHIVLPGQIKLTLKWEPDDLFPDPNEELTSFQFKLYINKSANTKACNVSVRLASDHGDSGKLAEICCGTPQSALLSKDKLSNTTKQLVGTLDLQCLKWDRIKVSFDAHQPQHCKCLCHQHMKLTTLTA